MHTVVREFTSDAMRAAIPRPESHLVVRFGPMTRDGIDVHAIGAREHVHRKHVRAGMRLVMARIPLGAAESVFGASAATIAGRIVPLEELWGRAARDLRDRLAEARDLTEVAALVEDAIRTRVANGSTLALAAADKLVHENVRTVAAGLGISERQLRRVFRDAVGMSPKSFARLARFQRAIDAAREGASWTHVAASTGYCDQAHLIDEFRAIAGTTPRRFVTELAESVM